MIRNIFSFLIFGILTLNLPAQIQRFRTTVSEDTTESNFGKNKKDNVSFTMQVGTFILAEKTFRPYVSTVFDMSVEYAHKVSKWYSYGFDFNFDMASFIISKTQGDKTFPDTIIHHKENISVTSGAVSAV